MVLPLCNPPADSRRVHPTHDHLSLNDVLAHASLTQDEPTFFNAIQQVLSATGDNWWDWQISNVPKHSALIQILGKINANLVNTEAPATTTSINTNTKLSNGRWFLQHSRFSASFDCRSEACPPQGKLKRNLRRLRKQLEEQGNVCIEHVVDADALPRAFDVFLQVEASGWKGADKSATAIGDDEQLRAFYQSLLTPSTQGLQPEINLLWCDEHCIAAQFGLRTGDYLSLLKIGYNEEYARYSPGYLLLESVLASTQTRNIHTLSLVTSPPWAERWHPNTVPVWHVNYYNHCSMGIALHQFNRFKQAAKARLKQAA